MIDDDFQLDFTKTSIETIFAQRDEADRIYKERLKEISTDKEKANSNYNRLLYIISDLSYELFGKISMKSKPNIGIIGDYIWVCWGGFLNDTVIKYHVSVLEKTVGELKEILKDKNTNLIEYKVV